jgi:hypothetical protein
MVSDGTAERPAALGHFGSTRWTIENLLHGMSVAGAYGPWEADPHHDQTWQKIG